MITKTKEDIQKFVSVESSFVLEKLQPHLNRVLSSEIYNLISKEQYIVFSNYSGSDEIIKQAIEFTASAEVNLAMYYYMQVGFMQITAGGIVSSTPNNSTPVAVTDIKGSLRFYKKTGLEAIDNLLSLMEENDALFPEWKASVNFTVFKSLLVNSTKDFQAHYNIFNSRQTFLALVSEIETVESKFIIPSLTNAVLTSLKNSDSADEIFQQVKKLVSKSIVLFTVSRVLGSGLFTQSATGFQVRFDVLDYERNFNSKEIISEYIKEQKQEKETEASNFLKTALNLIKANNTVFPEYIITETNSKPNNFFVKGKGIVGV